MEMHPPCQRISLVSIPFVLLSSKKTTPREPFWTTVIAFRLMASWKQILLKAFGVGVGILEDSKDSVRPPLSPVRQNPCTERGLDQE